MRFEAGAAISESAGRQMYELIKELYPICRSITGDGVRQTLAVLRREIPLEVHEVPSGTEVFDWTVPKEWNIRAAWIKHNGKTIVDFANHNLHILQYSVPIHRTMPLADLKPHLFSLPNHPDWIPYRTSYYTENWGFCLPHKILESLEDGEYEVHIDSSLADGYLMYGESVLQGELEDEILISCHVCHPSLCNDNLSGIAVATALVKLLQCTRRRYSYRFLFIPGAIGSVTWLATNEQRVSRIRHGLVITGVGDSGPLHYKRSRRGDTEVDCAVVHVLKHRGHPYLVKDFSPYGYDERQYCSPGFNLPVGSLTRTPHGQYPQYHTSADNLDFVAPEHLFDSLEAYLRVFEVLDGNRKYLNMNPKCEPRLGKRGIYRAVGGHTHQPPNESALLWVLNLADGRHALLDIAERAGLAFEEVWHAAQTLAQHGLLTELLDCPERVDNPIGV